MCAAQAAEVLLAPVVVVVWPGGWLIDPIIAPGVVQHIKPWTPPPVKVRDDELQLADIHDVPQQASAADDARTGNIGGLTRTFTPE